MAAIGDSTGISDAVQDYAKAIYSLQERSDEPVSTSALAERLAVSPASASAMVKRLESLGLVSRRPYHGVELTPAGQRVALEVIRHHRLLELYLAEALGMSWDRVHEEAEVLEHAISPELSELIAAKLGNPTHDPHGDPIPTADGSIHEHELTPLPEVPTGEAAEVRRVFQGDPERLRYLAALGLRPGATIAIVERQPFDGPLTVQVGPDRHVLGHELARIILCSRARERDQG